VAKRKRSAQDARQAQSAGGLPDPRRQGLRAFQAGRFDNAIALWSSLGLRDPAVTAALAEAYFRRALSRTGEQPIDDLRRAIELAPHQLRYQYHLGRALHQAGDLAGAIERYRSVLRQDAGWKGAGMALALAVLEQDADVDLAALPGSTPRVRSALAPVQALLRGGMPQPEGDGPLDRLWQGLGLIQAGDPAASDALAETRPLPTSRATAVRRYYKGVADARAGDIDGALAAWQGVYEAHVNTRWLLDNLVAVLQPRLRELGDAGELERAVALARSVATLAAGRAGLGELLVRTFDRAAQATASTGDWARAVGLWEEARQIVSSSSGLGSPRPLLHNLALAYEAQERWIEAADTWRAMLRTRPRGRGPAGEDRGADGQPFELSDAQWAWARKRVIECYKRGGEPGEAVTVFRQAIKADPNDLDTRVELADALLVNEQEQAAYNELQRILQVDPRHVEARLRLANLLGERGDWLAAEKLLREVLAEQPKRDDVRRQLAQLLLAHGMEQLQWRQNAAAERAFEEGRRIAPDDHQFPLNLARIAIDQRKMDRAEELLQQTLELAGDRLDAYLQVIAAWVVADKLDRARAVLAWAETSLPLTPDFYISLAASLLELSRRMALPNLFGPPAPPKEAADDAPSQFATELLERVVALRPNDARVRLQIAGTLMRIRPDLALSHAEAATQMEPNEPGNWSLLGLLLGLNDRKREAKETLRRGARLARQQGNTELAQEIEVLREQLDSPFFQFGLQFDSIFDDPDLDDEDWF
jgi:tetratricopeptide (TPR) repeat protein